MMNIIEIINETVSAFLNEKLANVDEDVNMIYDKYFAHLVKNIAETDTIDTSMLESHTIYSSILNSKDAIAANNIQRVKIIINGRNNTYDPKNSIINISLNSNAIDIVLEYGTIKNAVNYLGDTREARMLPLEFKEEKIKGSIHHELAHWIDDTLHNKHLSNSLGKFQRQLAQEKGTPNSVNSTKFEIEGHIHNIKQLKNKYHNNWDMMSFNDLIASSPSLNTIYRGFTRQERIMWLKDIKKRMYRENLLGKKMINN